MDVLTPEQRRLNMSRIRGRDTRPEVAVRKSLHERGYRFRLHRRDLPGRPDLVLPKWQAAIFVNGCFWHGHDCPNFKIPATRAEFWREKIARNVERDRAAQASLGTRGWRTLIVWECALHGRNRLTPDELGCALDDFLGDHDISHSEIREGHPSRQRW